MTESVKLRVNDLRKLMDWISTLEEKNFEVEITTTDTGIGPAIKALIETSENQGVWIDITDYSNW